MITIHDAWTHPELPWLPELVIRHQSVIDRRLGHGDLKRWSEALSSIPETDSSSATLGRAVGLEQIPSSTEQQLENALRGLMPWRKGPFKFGPITLDTEWRSDLKWDRLHSKIDLTKHRILDVG